MLYLASVGLAVHLILPQIPGLERSARLVAGASPLMVCAAFVAEVLSEACYAGLLGRSVAAASRIGTNARSRSRRGLGPWFMLRLTVCGYGAAHVLPGGGAAAATVTYGALRARGVDRTAVGLAVATVSALVYGALGLMFSGSLLYLLIRGDLTRAETAITVVATVLVVAISLAGYLAYRRPRAARQPLTSLIYRAVRVVRRRYHREEAEELVDRFSDRLDEELRSLRREAKRRPLEVVGWCFLAFGYWGFDAMCLVLVFHALGVPAGTGELLVAYGMATAAGSLPLTPGGIGVFEATMLATLALFGIGAEAAIPILGYRLFNFWMPIPLAALIYPTVHKAG
ncbi:MAG: flippase-like domain-containing protein [Actinomycetota bacterium]|nr:flippase-like domain-containing protein [Actinomycetota bacterium]